LRETDGVLAGDRVGDDPVGTGGTPLSRFGQRGWSGRRITVLVVAAALVVALIRALLVQSFVVPTGSMAPTVRAGDRVLVSRLAYRTGSVERGDVIVFDGSGVFAPESAPARSPLAAAGRAVAALFSLPVGSQDYVKRVVGLPGERVVCCDAAGRLTVDGTPLPEPYVNPGDAASTVRFDVVVPSDRLWVMGDHRSDSADSRAHLGDPGGGTVPVNRVVGRVVTIYWPLSRLGGLGGGSGSSPAARAVSPTIGRTHR
jgi:signal peptidase I